jgi:hypothetical protein
MHHDHGTLSPRQRQHIENLTVVELEIIVGHVDLEGAVALLDQRRQLLLQYRFGGIGNDHVKGVVDEGLTLATPMIIVYRGAQALALLLGGKGHHRGGATAGRRTRAAEKAVGHHRTIAQRLIQMTMRIDATGQYP